MGLSSTLYSGVSGLQTNSEAMSVTGNNISNSNTVAFKSSSTVFADLLSATISSSASGVNQVGRGTGLSTVQTSFSQGSFQSTSSNTDLAIEGDGFFMVSAAGSDEVLYTRNGAFSFDGDGYLVNADGYRVQGQLFNADGTAGGGDPTDIQVDMVSQVPAQSTSSIVLTTNLNAGSEIIDQDADGMADGFDIADPVNTSNYSTSTSIYDALGESHQVTTYFTKTDDQTWSWNTVVASTDLDASVAGAESATLIGSGILTFASDGSLSGASEFDLDVVGLAWANGADASQTIAIRFDTTQFNSSSVVFSQSQDGYAPGEVVSTTIGSDGVISVSYSNGETRNVATLTLATFTNPGGLVKDGGSLYAVSAYSGDPKVGTPGAAQGVLYTNSLELSNVDLSQEFVNLITIQNGYSASSKVITTVDEMLQEVINLIR
ncbi:flagellar hook protein FlgE [Desulfuromonas thiophila]|uniref:flagellar hook protein FlgE n=1 Tax=Desulfuromonas thiophila TaxID=57664 RepID=UPI0029F5785D|nr:flagellar hook protein FlgE [Desulfuromonas thiophila]